MTAPDRPADRDQQQAAEVLPPATLLDRMLYRTGYEDGAAAARAEEAARWQAKIEAVASHWDDGTNHGRWVAQDLRSLLDDEQQ